MSIFLATLGSVAVVVNGVIVAFRGALIQRSGGGVTACGSIACGAGSS